MLNASQKRARKARNEIEQTCKQLKMERVRMQLPPKMKQNAEEQHAFETINKVVRNAQAAVVKAKTTESDHEWRFEQAIRYHHHVDYTEDDLYYAIENDRVDMEDIENARRAQMEQANYDMILEDLGDDVAAIDEMEELRLKHDTNETSPYQETRPPADWIQRDVERQENIIRIHNTEINRLRELIELKTTDGGTVPESVDPRDVARLTKRLADKKRWCKILTGRLSRTHNYNKSDVQWLTNRNTSVEAPTDPHKRDLLDVHTRLKQVHDQMVKRLANPPKHRRPRRKKDSSVARGGVAAGTPHQSDDEMRDGEIEEDGQNSSGTTDGESENDNMGPDDGTDKQLKCMALVDKYNKDTLNGKDYRRFFKKLYDSRVCTYNRPVDGVGGQTLLQQKMQPGTCVNFNGLTDINKWVQWVENMTVVHRDVVYCIFDAVMQLVCASNETAVKELLQYLRGIPHAIRIRDSYTVRTLEVPCRLFRVLLNMATQMSKMYDRDYITEMQDFFGYLADVIRDVIDGDSVIRTNYLLMLADCKTPAGVNTYANDMMEARKYDSDVDGLKTSDDQERYRQREMQALATKNAQLDLLRSLSDKQAERQEILEHDIGVHKRNVEGLAASSSGCNSEEGYNTTTQPLEHARPPAATAFNHGPQHTKFESSSESERQHSRSPTPPPSPMRGSSSTPEGVYNNTLHPSRTEHARPSAATTFNPGPQHTKFESSSESERQYSQSPVLATHRRRRRRVVQVESSRSPTPSSSPKRGASSTSYNPRQPSHTENARPPVATFNPGPNHTRFESSPEP
jgi:hypothetical protein